MEKKRAKILVVEDESIVSLEIQDRLTAEGHEIIDSVVSGEAAYRKALETKPDLLLMDINLKGEMDGIQAAEKIKKVMDVPVIFLTAYSDENTLQRVQRSEPFGYLIKPFDDKELKTTINIALYKHSIEKKLKENQKYLSTILRSIGDGVIATDTAGKITFINPVAQNLTGFSLNEALGKKISEVIHLSEDPSGKSLDNPINKILEENRPVTIRRNSILTSKLGKKIQISDSSAPIKSPDGELLGAVLVISDITELRQTEKILKLSEKKYRDLVDNALVGVFRTHTTGEIIFANEALVHMLEYNSSSELMKKTAAGFYKNPEERNKILIELQSGKTLHNHEVELLSKSGKVINALLSITINEDIISGMVMDITERKKAEIEQLESERRYRTLFDSAGDAIFIQDMEGKFLEVNRLTCEYLGYSQDELLKMNIKEIQVIEDSINGAGEKPEIDNPNPIFFETTYKKKNGIRLPVELSWRLIEYSEKPAVQCIVRDLTERKVTEEKLLILSRAIEQNPASIIITDTAGNIEYVNKKFARMTGYTLEEIKGKNPKILKSGETPNEVYKQLWGTISGGSEWKGRFRNKKKNGEIFWEAASISPIKNHHNEVTHYIAFTEDITDRLKIESQVALSQKMESIGQLAAGIAHEINTPLQYVGDNTVFLKDAFGTISKYIDDVKHLVGEVNHDEVRENLSNNISQKNEEFEIEYLLNEIPSALDQSQVGISTMSKIVMAMKDFAHPGSKQKSYSDINHAIEVTANISRNKWKYVSDLTLELDPDLPLVFCLIDEINQVLLNMIVNAAHAIEDVVQKSPGEKGKIVIRTKKVGEELEISLSDTGTGIPKENLQRVFDPFFTTKEVGKGTGQGLAISHDIIVNKHKGKIFIDSEVGKGTTFILKIPINE